MRWWAVMRWWAPPRRAPPPKVQRRGEGAVSATGAAHRLRRHGRRGPIDQAVIPPTACTVGTGLSGGEIMHGGHGIIGHQGTACEGGQLSAGNSTQVEGHCGWHRGAARKCTVRVVVLIVSLV